MKRLQLLLLCLLWSGGSGLPQSSKRQPHQQQDQQPGMLPPPPPQALPPPPPQALPPQPIQSPPPGSQQSQLPFNGPQQVRPEQSDQFAQPGSFQQQTPESHTFPFAPFQRPSSTGSFQSSPQFPSPGHSQQNVKFPAPKFDEEAQLPFPTPNVPFMAEPLKNGYIPGQRNPYVDKDSNAPWLQHKSDFPMFGGNVEGFDWKRKDQEDPENSKADYDDVNEYDGNQSGEDDDARKNTKKQFDEASNEYPNEDEDWPDKSDKVDDDDQTNAWNPNHQTNENGSEDDWNQSQTNEDGSNDDPKDDWRIDKRPSQGKWSVDVELDGQKDGWKQYNIRRRPDQTKDQGDEREIKDSWDQQSFGRQYKTDWNQLQQQDNGQGHQWQENGQNIEGKYYSLDDEQQYDMMKFGGRFDDNQRRVQNGFEVEGLDSWSKQPYGSNRWQQNFGRRSDESKVWTQDVRRPWFGGKFDINRAFGLSNDYRGRDIDDWSLGGNFPFRKDGNDGQFKRFPALPQEFDNRFGPSKFGRQPYYGLDGSNDLDRPNTFRKYFKGPNNNFRNQIFRPFQQEGLNRFQNQFDKPSSAGKSFRRPQDFKTLFNDPGRVENQLPRPTNFYQQMFNPNRFESPFNRQNPFENKFKLPNLDKNRSNRPKLLQVKIQRPNKFSNPFNRPAWSFQANRFEPNRVYQQQDGENVRSYQQSSSMIPSGPIRWRPASNVQRPVPEIRQGRESGPQSFDLDERGQDLTVKVRSPKLIKINIYRGSREPLQQNNNEDQFDERPFGGFGTHTFEKSRDFSSPEIRDESPEHSSFPEFEPAVYNFADAFRGSAFGGEHPDVPNVGGREDELAGGWDEEDLRDTGTLILWPIL